MSNVKELTRDQILIQKDEVSNLTVVRWIKTTIDGRRCTSHCKHHWLYDHGVHFCKLFNEHLDDRNTRLASCKACKSVDTSKLPRALFI